MGRDIDFTIINQSTKSFNPRAHVGRDIMMFEMIEFDIIVSIHAPTWGATRLKRGEKVFMTVSIHAPTWGAT